MTVDLIYYVAGLCLILMAYMRTMLHMRLCHLVASSLFVGYGLLAEVWPVVVMNGLMIGVHALRLTRGEALRPAPRNIGRDSLPRVEPACNKPSALHAVETGHRGLFQMDVSRRHEPPLTVHRRVSPPAPLPLDRSKSVQQHTLDSTGTIP